MDVCLAVETLESIAFTVFNAWVLGALSSVLALIYLHKFFQNGAMIPRGSVGYLIKSFNWLVFGVAFLAFQFLPLTTGRALLRTAAALLLLSELSYLWYDIEDIIRQSVVWTKSRLTIS